MGCETITMPDGTRMIVCSRGQRTRRCACGQPATLLCDAPKGPTGKRTCSRSLCAACTTKDGACDLCPDHAPKPAAPAPPRPSAQGARRPIRALTLRQPWAHAVAHLGKRVENRTWAPPDWMLGAFVAIHAGAKIEQGPVGELLRLPGNREMTLVTTAVLAVATVERVVRSGGELPADQARWWVGPIGWVLTDVVVLPDPVGCMGAQGLWELPPAILARVRAQYTEARRGQ